MRKTFAVMMMLLTGQAWAEDDSDAAALALPGSEPQTVERPRAWQFFVEGAAGRSEVSELAVFEPIPGTAADQAGTANISRPKERLSTQRLSLDLQVDTKLSSDVRFVLADRLDVNWQHRFDQQEAINTLKEVYFSWQPRNDLIVDFGRINHGSGVALGYNPTDFFRDGAVRSLVSVDPASVKKNRQGSVMLRTQKLWEDASLMVMYSPALSHSRHSADFHPDWGATNRRDRASVVFSKRLGKDLTPQWVLYKDQGASPQLGMNLTKLINDSTVAYVEWVGGRHNSSLAEATGRRDDESYRNRIAAGLTYTTNNKISLTGELHYNGTGLDKKDWNALPRMSLQDYADYRNFTYDAQEMATRHSAFFYATWEDLLVNNLDLSAMVRYNRDDHSRLSWLELRYYWANDEIAWQWQGYSGDWLSEYGASSLRRAWQLLYRYYF